MNKTLVTSVIAAAGIAVSSFSFAGAPTHRAPAANPWYVGAGLNYNAISSMKFSTKMGHFKLNNSKLGYNLFVGNRLTKHFGTELQFSYIGKQIYKLESNSDYKNILRNLWNIQYDGYLYMPIHQNFDVFANGGLGYLHAINDNKGMGSLSVQEKLNTFALNVGAGVQYCYQNFGLRFGYNHYIPQKDINHVNGVQYPDIIKLDFMYKFS